MTIKLMKRVPSRVDVGTHETVRTIHLALDSSLRQLEANAVAAGGSPIACRQGCAACCTYPAQVSPEEASILVDTIQAMPKVQRDQVIARLAAWERAWALAKVEHTGDVGAWQARRIACPLLNLETHDCMVYDTRPIACRVHHAMVPPTPQQSHPDCSKCEMRLPPDGCFTTDEEISHGHRTAVWQYDPELSNKGLLALTEALGKTHLEAGFLVPMTSSIGRVRYRWPAPKKMVRLAILNSAFPKTR